MQAENTELFETRPIRQAVIALVVPMVISQLINMIYNMADTFFIGKMGDPKQVAAASLALPVIMLLTGLANLFGIGGASLISRSLGQGDADKARRCTAFSFWTATAVSLAYGLVIWLFRSAVLPAIGTNGDTYIFCNQYIFWTVTVGAVPTVLNTLLSHLVRSEGLSRQASFGVAFGGILNIALDPLFIFAFHLQIAGAAIATMLSNAAATAYFLALLYRKRGHLVMSLHPKYYTWRQRVPQEIFLVGFPSALINALVILSWVFQNRLMAGYSSEAVAGLGIARKLDTVSTAVAMGISQGVLPLIGYNYAAKNFRRMREAIKTTFLYGIAVAGMGTVILLVFADPIARCFIDDAATVAYGGLFLRLICSTSPCLAVSMIIFVIFQAAGCKIQPVVLSVIRKGGLDVPFMFLLNAWKGINGIVLASPIIDVLSMLASLILFIPFWRSLRVEEFNKQPNSDRL